MQEANGSVAKSAWGQTPRGTRAGLLFCCCGGDSSRKGERLELFGTQVAVEILLSFEQSVLKIISLENNHGVRYRFVDCEFPHCQDQGLGKKKEEKKGGEERGDEESREKGKKGLCRGWLAEWLTNIPGPQ